MGNAKAGGPPRKQASLLYATAVLLFSAVVSVSSYAADLSLNSKTYLLYFERDVAGAPKQQFLPLYEYLSGDAGNIGGMPVSFHFYGWGRFDFQDDSGTGSRSGELGSAYLQYNHPTGNGEVRLGRFFLAEGVATEILDGAFVKVRTPLGLGVSLFGGIPAEQTITTTETGDSLYGGRLFFARAGFAELGASYLVEKGKFQGDDREEVGGDVWVRPFGPLELIGRVTYNVSTEALAFQRYLVRVMPVRSVDLSVGYENYRYKDYFQTALNPAFLSPAIDNNDKVRIIFAVLDWEAVKNLTLEAAVKHIKHELDDPGTAVRGEAGVRYTYNNRKDVAGVSAAVVDGDLDRDRYQEYRAFGGYSPGKFRFTLEALTQRFKVEFADFPGRKNIYHVVGSAGYQVKDYLQVAGDLTYTQSPRFDEDFAGLVKVSLQLGTTTGGKK